MAFFDLPLEELETYLPEREEPEDFDAFWAFTIEESRAASTPMRRTEVDAGYSELVTEDVEFDGFGGQPIKGWFVAPRHRRAPLTSKRANRTC